MANIKEFTNVEGLKPDESAAHTALEVGGQQNRFLREEGTALGGAVSHVGGQVGARVDEHIAGQMIGHGSAMSTALWANLTQDWNNLASKTNPNDTSIGIGFREKNLEPSIEKFHKQFEDAPKRVQDWALQTADNMRSHFVKTISADEMTRAGQAVHQNIGDTFRNLSNNADLNPAGLPDYVAQLRLTKDALVASHGLNATGAAQVEKEAKAMEAHLAMAAVKGGARNNPQGTIDALNEGKFSPYMDALQQDQALKYAEGVKKDKRQEEEHSKMIARQDRMEASAEAKNVYVTAALNGKRMGDYANDPSLTAEAKENLRGFQHSLTVQARDNSENTPHPQVWRDLIDRLHTTAVKDPNNISDKPIYDLLREGKLNKAEFGNALSIFHSIDNPMERQINTYVKRAESFTLQSIEGSMMKKVDAAGYADAVNRFELRGRQEIAAARAKGEDVTPLVDPTSKQFVFAPTRFSAMLPTGKEVVKDAAAAARAGEKGPEVAGRLGGPAASSAPRAFKDEAEVKAAGLPDGTVVTIKGKRFVWNN